MGIRIYEAQKKFNIKKEQLSDLLTSFGYTGSMHTFSKLPDDIQVKLEKHFSSDSSQSGKTDISNKTNTVNKPNEATKQPLNNNQQSVSQKQDNNKSVTVNQNKQDNQPKQFSQSNTQQNNQQNNQQKGNNQQKQFNQQKNNNQQNNQQYGQQKNNNQQNNQQRQNFKNKNNQNNQNKNNQSKEIQPLPYYGESGKEVNRKAYDKNRDKNRRDRDYDDYDQINQSDERQLEQRIDRRLDKKRLGPKIHIEDDDDEIEVNKKITIIKTAPKKENQLSNKKKHDKNKNKRAHFSKKVQAEMHEQERQTEALLDRSKNQQVESEEDSLPKLMIPREVTVNDLAKYLEIDAIAIIKKLFELGVVASLNQRLEEDHIQLIGAEYGKEIVFSETVFEIEDTPDDEKDLKVRPPVVTVMGHVDHGKTSLIDYIRKTHVAAGEAGGITQHIGAYQVKLPNGTITFIDTPGHEAFTAMRAQGALVTDIVILIVAADDGVQPQTIEAIHHAQAANVPIIVAINKVDKPESNVERVKQQLMQQNLVADDWGGQTTMIPISAKTGQGVQDLLEMILLQAEMLELKANPNKAGFGTIIEARLDKGMGPMATVLVQNGHVSLGNDIICGTSYGRVKALINDAGVRVKDAGPAFPVMVLGLNEVPKVGDKMAVVESAKFARYVGELRMKREREERLSRENHIKLADLFKRVTEGAAKELNIIIKADVQGSCGALKDALERLSTDEVKVNVIHTAVGGITEADVNLASASNAIIIGFHVRTMTGVDEAAKREGVDIQVFRIIYDAIDAVKLALKGMYDPEYQEENIGKAEG